MKYRQPPLILPVRQWDQKGLLTEGLGNKFAFKVAQKLGNYLGSFEIQYFLSNKWCAYFLGHFCQNLATFYGNIWPHCCCMTFEWWKRGNSPDWREGGSCRRNRWWPSSSGSGRSTSRPRARNIRRSGKWQKMTIYKGSFTLGRKCWVFALVLAILSLQKEIQVHKTS